MKKFMGFYGKIRDYTTPCYLDFDRKLNYANKSQPKKKKIKKSIFCKFMFFICFYWVIVLSLCQVINLYFYLQPPFEATVVVES